MQFDCIELEAKEFYRKRSYRNRSLISSPNGVLNLSVPLLKGKNNALPMDKVGIAYHDNWEKKICRAIQSSYGKTAFFLHYFDELEDIFKSQPSTLLDLNTRILKWLLEGYQIDCDLKYTQTYQETELLDPQTSDLRDLILPNKQSEDLNFNELPYPQVFEAKTGFLEQVSAIELLFTQGPQGIFHIQNCTSI